MQTLIIFNNYAKLQKKEHNYIFELFLEDVILNKKILKLIIILGMHLSKF